MCWNAFCASSAQENFFLVNNASVIGKTTEEKFGTNLLYQPAMPKKPCTCLIFLGTGHVRIASTLSGSVFIPPFGSLAKIPSILGRGYASFWVTKLTFLASRHRRTLFGLTTKRMGELHGDDDCSITPKASIRSISLYISFSTAGETDVVCHLRF
ncbi:hypothetical protein FF38_09964 [Lucilia cuprina]|uniref:Uncharacterized protein n=1 Tax=Lucilia cuprina TaxID=7375 RepID=A0A0L0C959_LUCCU|nr:hypothetical protein FF38_09964 [Lucilia cuprina]